MGSWQLSSSAWVRGSKNSWGFCWCNQTGEPEKQVELKQENQVDGGGVGGGEGGNFVCETGDHQVLRRSPVCRKVIGPIAYHWSAV